LFNRFKERLKGFKEAVSTKIQEKGEAEAKAAEKTKAEEMAKIEEKRPASEKGGASVAKEGEAEPASEKNASKTKQSFTTRAKSLIFEQEVVLDEKDLADPLWELEMALLESDVALPVAETIVSSVKDELVGRKKKIRADTGEIVEEALRSALFKVLSENYFDVDEFIAEADKPVKIVFVGVNGTGKTTSIAKVAKYLRDRDYSVVLAVNHFQGRLSLGRLLVGGIITVPGRQEIYASLLFPCHFRIPPWIRLPLFHIGGGGRRKLPRKVRFFGRDFQGPCLREGGLLYLDIMGMLKKRRKGSAFHDRFRTSRSETTRGTAESEKLPL